MSVTCSHDGYSCPSVLFMTLLKGCRCCVVFAKKFHNENNWLMICAFFLWRNGRFSFCPPELYRISFVRKCARQPADDDRTKILYTMANSQPSLTLAVVSMSTGPVTFIRVHSSPSHLSFSGSRRWKGVLYVNFPRLFTSLANCGTPFDECWLPNRASYLIPGIVDQRASF